ncbi:MAG: PEGA domain-containing protein [Acidobacteriota bacterium]
MKLGPQILFRFLLFGSCVIATACTIAPPTNSGQRNGNANAAQSNAPQTNSSAAKPSRQPNQSTTGSIEVSSVPAGARVLLVSTDAGGAGEPQSKGLTPTTITGLEPGKYTVDLERPGYRFFQQKVEVRAGKTLKINATLKKQ